MKTFKAICAALVLAFSLSVPAYADGTPGDVHVPGKPIPCSDAPTTPSGDTELADGSTAVESDFSFADILWALASIF